MSQFIMIELSQPIDPPDGIQFLEISPAIDDFIIPIVKQYFSCPEKCRLVADITKKSESLIDDVWEAQQKGRDFEGIPFVKLMKQLIQRQIPFVCWYGSDYQDLPEIRSWPEFYQQLRRQTIAQPAELYVRFEPDL